MKGNAKKSISWSQSMYRQIFSHFQRNMWSVVHSESQMIRKNQDLLTQNIIPILHLVSERKLFEDKEDYHERLQYEYASVFQKYPDTFQVVNTDSFGGNDQQGRTLINMNEILRNAVSNNCKVIVNDNSSTTNHALNESRRLMDSYIYNFNTEHEANVYKIYDVSSPSAIESLTTDISIHKEYGIYMGLVLTAMNENDHDTISDVFKHIQQTNLNVDMIVADNEQETMSFVRIPMITEEQEEVQLLPSPSIMSMKEILFSVDTDEPLFEPVGCTEPEPTPNVYGIRLHG